MKRIRQTFDEGSLILDLKARSLRSVFHQVLNFLAARKLMPLDTQRREEIERNLLAREKQTSTAIGHSVAVPHLYDDALTAPVLVFVRLDRPLNLGAPDGIPTRYFFLLMGPTKDAAKHLDTLANIARLMSDDLFRFEAGEAKTQQELIEAFDRFRERTAPPKEPREEEPPDELRFTGRFAGGLIGDVRRRLPYYLSDFRDGIHPKCVASTLFLYFACLAPTVAFGGLLDVLTEGRIGAVETLVATAVGGIVYALFAGQPLTIIASTGPIVIFLGILYSLCAGLGVPFLPALGWVGLWTALFTIIIALTDLTAVVRFCTRFTDEIFAALIALIYIVEAVRKLTDLVNDPEVSHDTSLLSLLLGVGAFLLAMNLSRFRHSRYLLPKVREFLADFGPAIAIGAMTIIAVELREVPLATMDIPETFQPTLEGRTWLVPLFSAPRWVWFAAAVPALFATVLVFLDQNITVRLVNNPTNKVRKGVGWHLDMLVVGVLIAVCSLFGLPWLVAATVRSLNHVRSLAAVEEVIGHDGAAHERILFLRENRVTALSIGALIGLSLLLLPVLKAIPLAVLFGLFLFMGVVSLKGNQFFERLSLWLMDPSLYPSTHYIRRVPTGVVHKYTLLQLACLIALWVVRSGPPTMGILFPLLIALLVPVRFLAGRFFNPEHLEALDSEEEPEEEGADWGGG